MVELNATLIVELVLFLLLLAGCHYYVFKPVLRQLDAREDKIGHDVQLSQREHAEAAALEEDYSRQLTAARRAVAEELRRVRYAAEQDQDVQVLEAKKAANTEVAHAHAAAQAWVASQRDEVARLAPDIAKTLTKKLGLGDLG